MITATKLNLDIDCQILLVLYMDCLPDVSMCYPQ